MTVWREYYLTSPQKPTCLATPARVYPSDNSRGLQKRFPLSLQQKAVDAAKRKMTRRGTNITDWKNKNNNNNF